MYIPRPHPNEAASSYSNRLARLSVPTGGRRVKQSKAKAWRKVVKHTTDKGTVYEGKALVQYLLKVGAVKQAEIVLEKLKNGV